MKIRILLLCLLLLVATCAFAQKGVTERAGFGGTGNGIEILKPGLLPLKVEEVALGSVVNVSVYEIRRTRVDKYLAIEYEFMGGGTGSVIADHIVLVCNHEVADPIRLLGKRTASALIEVGFNGRIYEAHVFYPKTDDDPALLRDLLLLKVSDSPDDRFAGKPATFDSLGLGSEDGRALYTFHVAAPILKEDNFFVEHRMIGYRLGPKDIVRRNLPCGRLVASVISGFSGSPVVDASGIAHGVIYALNPYEKETFFILASEIRAFARAAGIKLKIAE